MTELSTPTTAEATLEHLLELALPICRRAQDAATTPRRGRPDEYPDWVIAALIFVAVAHRRTSKSAQYRFLNARRDRLRRPLGLDGWPSRSTYCRRYRRAHRLFKQAIAHQSAEAVDRGQVEAGCVAADTSLVPARGQPWHRRHGSRRRRGVDPEARWGRSAHRGWVYGYSFEVVVTTARTGPIWPLLASVDAANRSESRSLAAKIGRLPRSTRYVLVDRGYDSDSLAEAVEGVDGRRWPRRRLVGPQIMRAQARRTRRRAWRCSRRRRRRRVHRVARRRFFESRAGQSLYARRGRTVEPFHEWLKDLFGLSDRVWHRGLDNNRTQLLAAIFAYQVLLRFNHNAGRRDGRVKWILDQL